MIIPRGLKTDASNEVHNRALRIEDLKHQNLELLNMLNKYASVATELNNIEQQLGARLQLWYTDHSLYSTLATTLKDSIDYRSNLVNNDLLQMRAAIATQLNAENDVYTPIKASVNNYSNSSKRYDHYRQKLPKLKTQGSRSNSQSNLSDSKVSGKKLERILRNERKLENTRLDTEAYEGQIITESSHLNLDRFQRINPIIQHFINILLGESLRSQERFMEVRKHQNVLDAREGEFFNQKYFMPVVSSRMQPLTESHVQQVVVNDGASYGLPPHSYINSRVMDTSHNQHVEGIGHSIVMQPDTDNVHMPEGLMMSHSGLMSPRNSGMPVVTRVEERHVVSSVNAL